MSERCLGEVMEAEEARYKYSLAERIFLVTNYYKLDADYRAICELFTEHFPNSPVPTYRNIHKLHTKFQRTGNVADAPRSGRPRSARTEENKMRVAQTFVENPRLSGKRAAVQLDLSRRSLHRIMHDLGLKVYRPRLLQELKAVDRPKRVEFCEWFLIMSAADPDFVNSILWSDEAIFKVNGRVNRHNCVYWADENPQEILQREVNSPGIMVWAGVNVRGVIGPYFFEQSVNADSYLELLHELHVTLFMDERFAGRRIIFQQDGAPAHFALRVRNFLNKHFPDWIGRNGRTAYPPRSPDLTLMDFSVWGLLKDRVFAHPIANVDDLKFFITQELDFINEDRGLLQRMVAATEKRYLACIEAQGGHFE